MATSPPRAFYLDSSAILKLVVREAETSLLQSLLSESILIVSEIASVEVPRAAHLKCGAASVVPHAEAILQQFYRVALDRALLASAARLLPPNLRTLDAIHLSAALRVRDQIQAIVVYDTRLAAAARQAGLPVAAPGVEGLGGSG